MVKERAGDSADTLAVLDRDRLLVVDGDAQRAPRLARLVESEELITHVVQRGLEQLFDRRYGPGRHVRCVPLRYRTAYCTKRDRLAANVSIQTRDTHFSRHAVSTRLRWLVLKAGLPRPEVQPHLHDQNGAFVGRADLYYADARLVIECDGGNHRGRIIDDDRRQNLI